MAEWESLSQELEEVASSGCRWSTFSGQVRFSARCVAGKRSCSDSNAPEGGSTQATENDFLSIFR